MPSTELRENVLSAAKRLVVKVGTQLLTADDGGRPGLDLAFIASVARQIAALRRRGHEVTLVSSGAVGAGCVELGLTRRPTDVADQQAVAAVGQRRLMTHLHDAFEAEGLHVGQLLLTRSDFDDRTRFLNLRNCVRRLHEMGCVPILNENDTVAVEEIRFGDNDTLAALMCNAVRAHALVLLTVVEGLLDEDGRRIDLVDDVEASLGLVRQEKSGWGTGGMLSKLEAARLVTEAGEVAVIASGREPDVLVRLWEGEKLGTVFLPAARKLDSRQRWIGLTARPGGSVTIDDGAAKAVAARGKSLLASGVTQVEGAFQRGDVVLVCSSAGQEIARGLSNYDAEELRLIAGRQSDEFETLLGRPAYEEVIHRDNLVVLSAAKGQERR
ncbi:MAG: glutamate 5-kinase [Phycisphaeraceae bacterium]